MSDPHDSTEVPGSEPFGPLTTQSDLPLDAPPLPQGVPLLPARMVNEYVYCARLAYLEWVQGEWADSADTVEGRQATQGEQRGKGRRRQRCRAYPRPFAGAFVRCSGPDREAGSGRV
jgi:hypothetical protein